VGIGRVLRPVSQGRALKVNLEASVAPGDLGALLDDYQGRLLRAGVPELRAQIRSQFETTTTVKAVCRTPAGSLQGAALLNVEGNASDIAFLHIMPRFATESATARLLDALLGALPEGTGKVRAQVATAGRWLHLSPARARNLLTGRAFAPLTRALMLRDLRRPLPDVPATPAGYAAVAAEPGRADEWGRFAFEAYQQTTDFAVITLEETQDAYRRLYVRFLGGEFGTYARGMSFAAVPEGEASPAGVLHTVFVGPEPYVGDLSVLPAHRGRGLGRFLLLKALSAYAAAGAKRAGLTATEENEPAFSLYRSVGFEVVRSSEVFVRYA
jgi:ribosomal protein S18 acetylase RimI-like enzyme